MYKLIENLPGLESNIVQRLSDNVCIPFDSGNIDYQRFLDDINEHGESIVDAEIPQSVLTNATNRKFNKQLDAYVAAVSRLEQYILSEGKEEVKVLLPTGEKTINPETAESEDVLAEVVTQAAIPPLAANVEVWEQEEGSAEVKKTVRNPLIVRDEQERAAAQAIVDATPEEVKVAAAAE
jgi:hypothetical protein